MMSKKEAVELTKKSIATNRQKKGKATIAWIEAEVDYAIEKSCESGVFDISLRVPETIDTYFAIELLNKEGYTAHFFSEGEDEILVISWR